MTRHSLPRPNIPARYAAFAVMQFCVIWSTQRCMWWLYRGPYWYYVGMLLGTLAGLALKYPLDKKFIYAFRTKKVSDNAVTFFMYSLMSVFTTLVFWSIQTLCFYLIPFSWGKDIGTLVGLSAGHCAKYFLDRRFTFILRGQDRNPHPGGIREPDQPSVSREKGWSA